MVIDLLRSRVALEAEILVLRQQINVVPIGNLIRLAREAESRNASVL
jgi:hypothetical protein